MSDSLAHLSLQIQKQKLQNEKAISQNLTLLEDIKQHSLSVKALSKNVSEKHLESREIAKIIKAYETSIGQSTAKFWKLAKFMGAGATLLIIAQIAILINMGV
ncbi:hypothetical protein A7317_26825 [Pseudomonas fluorescens]|nr:hypothetical protein A7317_26825 [Pseudomonas fluorescens]AOE76261.1 hypothetical protein A7319_26600 [Pseudomonas fluorescens]